MSVRLLRARAVPWRGRALARSLSSTARVRTPETDLGADAADAVDDKSATKTTPPPLVFTRDDLSAIRAALLPPPSTPIADIPPHTSSPAGAAAREAAVLLPLCNIAGAAHLLMEVRASGLRVHGGEASFPGGKAEPSDANMVEVALRETEEELSLPASHVEVLGALEPEYSLGNKARVWPVVGFVHNGDAFDAATNAAITGAVDASLAAQPLPSLSLSNLHPDAGEVSALIPLPLSTIADPARKAAHYFRLDGRRPYWKIRCGDLVLPPQDEPEPLEVWGLSGWFLSRLAVTMRWSGLPPPSLPPTDD